jgi:hypothetical protein
MNLVIGAIGRLGMGGARAAAATITRNGSAFRATLSELSADSHDKSDLAEGHPLPSPSSRHYVPICWNEWFLGPVPSEFSAPPDPAPARSATGR